MNLFRILSWSFVIVTASCNSEKPTLFKLISPDYSGIHFSNDIIENDTLNIIEIEYVYNGGGVGIADFNNDGLQDIYFSGNVVENKLYLNQGALKFKDVTVAANVAGSERWSSGVSLVDINNDGWQDIYVGATLVKDSTNRANLLYINQGINTDGVPSFQESAAAYGIDDTGHTTQSAFFDYDNDGDLDLYVLTNHIDEANPPSTYRFKIADGSSCNNDRLYRNNGNGTFSNVTREAGILMEGYGLGVSITDVNQDGWQDVYVSNDYISNDLLWINNQDGTFTNKIDVYFKHQSGSAMGNDVGDINNDGFADIVTVDMMPEDNKRKKMMIRANNYVTYFNNEKFDYEYQYVRNTLQLNSGPIKDNHPVFSEIGQLSGMYQTDWSWSPLLADFDNDGFRDLIITNGFPRDVTDHDFAAYASGIGGSLLTPMQLLDSIPQVKISNYAFRNNKDLTFSDQTREWGMEIASFSNGAAYADLDNDGDLDYVVNNINDKAFLYENRINSLNPNRNESHYLRIKFQGDKANIGGLGTKVTLNYAGKQQYYEHTPFRGYISTVENAAHFGLKDHQIVDSVQVYWPDGRYQLLLNISADQEITVQQENAEKIAAGELHHYKGSSAYGHTLFEEVSQEYNLNFTHKERDKVDFNLQRTLPHKFTQSGPGIAAGDIDGNGQDDVFIGGSAGETGVFFLQNSSGTFNSTTNAIKLSQDKAQEDMGVLLFDADNDSDLDLYVTSGSYEYQPDAEEHKDRLYINDGKGFFEEDTMALPQQFASGSCVKAADYDQDGDLDLFIGGSVIPGRYPYPSKSFILRNEGGEFIDVTADLCPEIERLGIINDALWTDFDNDGLVDLIIVGEWMPISFFRNSNGKFTNVTNTSGLDQYKGWWNSLTSGDFDRDGDIDYVAGNLGLNTNYKGSREQPLKVYAGDFDGNGSIDPVLSVYLKGKNGKAPFPMHAKDDLTSQILPMKRKFTDYASYSKATIHDVLSEKARNNALVLEGNYFSSSYIENLGNGTFKLAPLPIQAQFAPVFGMVTDDFDGDGNLDILLAGNSYAMEVTTGRYDALNGLYLKGNGKGAFKTMPGSGFFVAGDAKGMATLEGAKGEKLILVTQNKDDLKTFSFARSDKSQSLALQPLDAWADIIYKDGSRARKEFYYGSAYFSQSARNFSLDDDIKAVIIHNYSGSSRKIIPEHMVASRKTTPVQRVAKRGRER